MSLKPKISVEIDSRSGFCFGVVNAISQAEQEIMNSGELHCLGEIVHNEEEVNRLKSLGLKTVAANELGALKGKRVLIRAHGEPPETYKNAIEQGVTLVDASCPVVLKLQVKVHEGWKRMNEVGGQILIFGKKGHAEVIGLVGQTNGNAKVIEGSIEIDSLDFSIPTELFAQTTKSSDEFNSLAEQISQRMGLAANGGPFHFKVHNTICGQVANRKVELIEFSKKHSVIVFVSGKTSSNGKMLYDVCKSINPSTYFISSIDEICFEWFNKAESVGVCGATSTPLWLMEKVAKEIEQKIV